MSFRSKAQQRFFFAAERDGRLARGTAKDWADETDFSTLPEKASGLAHAHESARGASDAQLRAGIKIEMEHTDDPNTARQIALDHLRELPDYYTRLKAMESAGEKTARSATFKQLKKWKLQGHRTYRGLEIAVENRKGSKRHWHDAHNNTSGSTTMIADYGFVQGSMGMDGEEVDCYVGDDAEATHVYVIDQMKTPDFKKFDEQKCMIGFPSAEAAEAAYRKQYDKPGFFGSMKAMPFDEFKEKVMAKKYDGKKIAGLLHAMGLLTRPPVTRPPAVIMKLNYADDADHPKVRREMLKTLEHMDKAGKLSEDGKAALPMHRAGEHDRIHDNHFVPGAHLEAQDFFERAMGWKRDGSDKSASDYRAALSGTKEFRRAVLGAAEKNLASHLPELAKREGYSVATALTGKGKGELGHRFARGAVRETIDGTSIGKALGSIKKAALSPALLSSLTHGAAGAGIGAAAGGVGGALHAGEGHRAQGFRRGALVGAGLGAAGGVGVSALKGQGGRQLASLQQAAAGAHDEATAIHQGLKNWTPVPGVGGAPHAPARVPVDVNASTVRAQAAGTPTAATMAGRPGVRPAPTAAPRADMATGVARPGATPGLGPRPDSVVGAQGRHVMSPDAWGYRQTEGGGVVRKTPAPAATVAPQAAAAAPTPSHYRMPTETQAASAGGRAEALRQAANTLGQQQGVMNTNINRAAMVGAAGGTGLMGYMAVPQQYGGVAPQKTASGDMLQYFADHPEKLEEKRMRDKAKQKTASYAAARVIAMSGGDISWYEEQEKAAATKEQIHDGVDNAGLALMAAPYLVKTVADLAERRHGAAAHDVSEGVHALKPEITKAVKAAKPGMLRGISNALHSAEHIIEPVGLAMVSPFVGKRLANRFGKDEDKTAGVGSSLGRLVRGAGEHVDELAHMGKNLVAAPGRRIGNMQHAAREEMAAFRSARAGVPHRPLPPTIDPTPRPTVSARVPPTAQGLGPAGPQAPMSPTAKGLAALEQTAGPRTGGFEVPTKAPPVPATAPGVPTTAPGAPGAPGTGVVDRIRSGVRRYGVPLAGAGMLAGGGLAYGGVNLGANVLNHAVPEGPLDIPTVQGQRGVFAR